MLSKKKDSGINDGIAGKYVKRETPPMLRSKFHLLTDGYQIYCHLLYCQFNIDHSFMMCTNVAIMKYFLYEKRNN